MKPAITPVAEAENVASRYSNIIFIVFEFPFPFLLAIALITRKK